MQQKRRALRCGHQWSPIAQQSSPSSPDCRWTSLESRYWRRLSTVGLPARRAPWRAINPARSGANWYRRGRGSARGSGGRDRETVSPAEGGRRRGRAGQMGRRHAQVDERTGSRRHGEGRWLQGACPGVLAGAATSTWHLQPLRGVERLDVSGLRAVVYICNDTAGTRLLFSARRLWTRSELLLTRLTIAFGAGANMCSSAQLTRKREQCGDDSVFAGGRRAACQIVRCFGPVVA